MTTLGRIAATALLALAALPVTAENRAAEAFFDKLAGTWQGQGEVRQMSANMRMQWEPVLDGESWHFKAHGYYHLRTDDTIDGTWFASRGLALPLTGRIDGDAMTIDWGIPDVERGRSTYRLSAMRSKSSTRPTRRTAPSPYSAAPAWST